jgi:hypothetical protein
MSNEAPRSVSTSVRLPMEEYEFLLHRARQRSFNAALLEVVRDARTLFGLPGPMRAALEEALLLRGCRDSRDYLQALLAEEYRRLPLGSR